MLTSSIGSYCALLPSSGVDCWGQNSYGELGNGTWGSGSSTPVQVQGVGGTGFLSNVTNVTGGYYSYCAILTTTNLDCWGFDAQGELGAGVGSGNAPDSCTLGCSTTPLVVLGTDGTGSLSGVVSIASTGDGGTAGSWCAVLSDTSVVCWGWGAGPLGGAGGQYYPTPYLDGGSGSTLSGVARLVGSPPGAYGSYCAILISGGAECWRTGNDGQLGNGVWDYPSIPSFAGPGSVLGIGGTGILSGVTDIADGSYSYCAVASAGAVACWGANTGDLGNGTTTGPDACYGSSPCASSPVAVLGVGGTGTLTGATSVVSDTTSYCVVLNAGAVDCWGVSGNGALGNGMLTDSDVPVAVLAPM
jgi:hypothetical protein